MKIAKIKELLGAELVHGMDMLDQEVESACGSDLMSDVLAFVNGKTLLLTGLTNHHVIRTAEMLDVSAIVFVRGKKPADDVLKMAIEKNIAVLTTDLTLYVACGILYQNGLSGNVRGG